MKQLLVASMHLVVGYDDDLEKTMNNLMISLSDIASKVLPALAELIDRISWTLR